MNHISFGDFLKVDMRVGRIVDVQDFPEARKPAYKLKIDFGQPLGVRQSSAQLRQTYGKQELMNKRIIAVVNFPPKHVAGFKSEVLVLGVPDQEGNAVLIAPDERAENGGRVY
ncbi:MAG: tRNA-binding protein [Candidatus Aenigmarchaeota archaeon]|nr:tRNA-binding protein [Candidatus Aenigmarchaeota archaeon]